MYPNKLIISSMCHQFVLNQPDCRMGPTNSTCHQLVLNQQDCRIGPCKNKDSTNINIQRCAKSQTNIQTQIPISN